MEKSHPPSHSSWREWFQTPTAKSPTTDFDPKSFIQFCDYEDESIVYLGPVWKRRALSCHLRILILTSTPRLLYVDHVEMVLKGEVPWTAEQPIRMEVSQQKNNVFDIVSPLDGNRSYHFEVFSGTSQPWETMIASALADQKFQSSKGSVSGIKKSKTTCKICQKHLGLMKRGYHCEVCKHMVCSECSEDIKHGVIKGDSSPHSSSKEHVFSGRVCEDCAEQPHGTLTSIYSSDSVSSPSSSASRDSSWLGFSFGSRSGGEEGQASQIEVELTQPKPSTTEQADDVDVAVKNGRAVFQKHNESEICNACKVKFSTNIRRHHCRACGLLFCHNCSSGTFPLASYNMYPQRVCDSCAWTLLRALARQHACAVLKVGCALCCWSRCLTTSCAEKGFSKQKAVAVLKKIANPFGPLWGRFKLNFLLAPKKGRK